MRGLREWWVCRVEVKTQERFVQHRGRGLTAKVLMIVAAIAICQFSLLTASAGASAAPRTYAATAGSSDNGKTFETLFKSSRTLNGKYLFDVELWDTNNQRVFQSYGTTWVRNTDTKSMVRSVPTDLPSGTYTIQAGWFSPNWVSTLLWESNAGSVVIGSPATTTNDLNGWKYIFGDSFDRNAPAGSFLSTYDNWAAYDTGWSDTSRRGTYDNDIISTSNGLMNIHLHTGADGKPRAAVPIPLINGRGADDETNQLYGRYEVRFRSDEIAGYKTAFLLWPKSEVWPRDGEIDFPEGNLNDTIGGYVHRQGATSGGDQAGFSTSARYSSWHTAVMEWTPTSVKLILDDQVVGNTTTRVPNTPMHWALQSETCLDGCDIPANASGDLQIDYVKVWKYDRSTVIN